MGEHLASPSRWRLGQREVQTAAGRGCPSPTCRTGPHGTATATRSSSRGEGEEKAEGCLSMLPGPSGTCYLQDRVVPLGSALLAFEAIGLEEAWRCWVPPALTEAAPEHRWSSSSSRHSGSRRCVVCRSRSTVVSILMGTKDQDRLQKNCSEKRGGSSAN